MAVDGLGRITLAGSALRSGSTDNDVVLIRLLDNGAFDAGFGASGILQTDISGSGSEDWASAIALLPGGGAIVAGGSDSNFALARYAPGG